MIEFYELQFFDVGELVGRMLMIDRFKINHQKFNNSIGILGYHHNLIIFPNMACEMLIESSRCPLKKLRKKFKKRKKSHLLELPKSQITNFWSHGILRVKNLK